MAASAIKMSASELESMVSQIDTKLNSLRSNLEKYKSQESSLYSMMGSGDSSAALMLQVVQANIAATEKAISIANAALIMLRKTQSELDAYVSQTTASLNNASTQVASGVSKAVNAAKLG